MIKPGADQKEPSEAASGGHRQESKWKGTPGVAPAAGEAPKPPSCRQTTAIRLLGCRLIVTIVSWSAPQLASKHIRKVRPGAEVASNQGFGVTGEQSEAGLGAQQSRGTPSAVRQKIRSSRVGQPRSQPAPQLARHQGMEQIKARAAPAKTSRGGPDLQRPSNRAASWVSGAQLGEEHVVKW